MSQRRNNRPTLERRLFVAGLAGAAALPLARPRAQSRGERAATPAQTLGPFYPRDASERPRETGPDLLRLDGDRVLSKGVPLYFTGTVIDARGTPVRDAMVEIWQCDANAVYHHPAGGAEGERDPNFQGYGVTRTDAAGSFHFRTIRPVAYPGRTPHIHVRVRSASGQTLATQFYLPDDPGNGRDFLFGRLAPAERQALTVQIGPATPAAHPLARATAQTARAAIVLA